MYQFTSLHCIRSTHTLNWILWHYPGQSRGKWICAINHCNTITRNCSCIICAWYGGIFKINPQHWKGSINLLTTAAGKCFGNWLGNDSNELNAWFASIYMLITFTVFYLADLVEIFNLNRSTIILIADVDVEKSPSSPFSLLYSFSYQWRHHSIDYKTSIKPVNPRKMFISFGGPKWRFTPLSI